MTLTYEPIAYFGYPDDCEMPPGAIVRLPQRSAMDLLPAELRLEYVKRRLDAMLNFYPHLRASARDFLCEFADDASSLPDDVKGNSILHGCDVPIPVSFFSGRANYRRDTIIWLADIVMAYFSRDIRNIGVVLYATMRMFDYYMAARGFTYAIVTDCVSGGVGSEYVQNVLSCCLALQLKTRCDVPYICYKKIADFGRLHNADLLVLMELEIFVIMNGSCLVTTPIDFLDHWNTADCGIAKRLCMQTLHSPRIMTCSAYSIAVEALMAARVITGNTEPLPDDVGCENVNANIASLLEVYGQDPLFTTPEMQKIIDAL
jgi:hypothetical protein